MWSFGYRIITPGGNLFKLFGFSFPELADRAGRMALSKAPPGSKYQVVYSGEFNENRSS